MRKITNFRYWQATILTIIENEDCYFYNFHILLCQCTENTGKPVFYKIDAIMNFQCKTILGKQYLYIKILYTVHNSLDMNKSIFATVRLVIKGTILDFF